LKNNSLKPVVGREFPLADAAQAHRAIMEPERREDSAGDIAAAVRKYSNIARALALSSLAGGISKTVMAHRFLDDRVFVHHFNGIDQHVHDEFG